jgi:alpha-amylase/alpha-mannosidase (GH57 family)
MHQPSYVDPDTGRSVMPWVRLHAMKDYYDMGRLVNEIDGARAVFNFVPSLWDQLEHIACGEWQDEHERISRKRSEQLDRSERLFVAKHFFSCQYDNMISPYPAFRELYHRFGPQGDPELILSADTKVVTDLEVWFHLAWCGHTLQEDPFIRGLIDKGSNFSHEEKIELLDRIRGFIGKIPAFYKEMAEKGRAELSVTPYYHPILPLLLDPDSAHVACPSMALPRERFRLEVDARAQVRRALERHESLFGHKPAGCWPAEGSVSPAAAAMFAENGVRWIATDERILRNSLGGDELDGERKFQPYRYNGVSLFFRDLRLSDRIGFEYSHFRKDEAVADFLKHLHNIRESLPERDGFIVPIILDGENCWEFYKQHGWPFLMQFYRGLVNDPDIKLTTFAEYLDNNGEAAELSHLHSGSWIEANFTTWVGDPIKNKAWSFLYQALKAAGQAIEEGKIKPEDREKLQEVIYAAEGSDWFWWFGEGHTSDYDATFDLLFRKHLSAIYRLIGEEEPAYLMQPVDDRWLENRPYLLPAYTIKPRIDGTMNYYWEWLPAGVCRPSGGSMQRAQDQLSRLLFGFDDDHLFFRVETPLLGNPAREQGMVLEFQFQRPERKQFMLPVTKTNGQAQQTDNGMRYAVEECIEAELPFTAVCANGVDFTPGDPIEFSVVLKQDGREIERLPQGTVIHLSYPADSFDDENWFI